MTDNESMDDAELLRRFAAEHSEASFARLARRHTGLVFDIALRVTGSRPLAEEIAQNVFLGLARKASRVAKTRVVAAWLHRAAVLESRAALRAERRHRKRLMEAAPMITEPSPPSDPRMTELLQSLDEALNSLPMAEREILLSHYYGRQSYQEAGLRLGTSEAGARQLAARARKRLAAWFGRRGKEVPAASIGTLLAGHFPAAAPSSSSQAALEAAVTRAVLSPPGPPPSSVLTEFLKCLPLMKIPAALCLLAGFLITFLPGRGMPGRDTAAVPDAAQKTIQPLPSPAGRSRPGSGAAALTDGFDLSQFEKEMATVVRLSKERHLGFNTGSAVARAFDLSYGRQWQLARLVMNQPVSRMPALLEACQRTDPGAKGSVVLEAIFARWAEGDPAAAREAMTSLDRKSQNLAMHGICGTLIKKDVSAAAREALNFPTEIKDQFSDGSRKSFITGIISACVERDPKAALTACLDAPERIAGQALEQGMRDWIRVDPVAATHWFGQIRSTRLVPGNGQAERLCVALLEKTRPDLASELVASLPAGELRDSLASRLRTVPVATPDVK